MSAISFLSLLYVVLITPAISVPPATIYLCHCVTGEEIKVTDDAALHRNVTAGDKAGKICRVLITVF